MKKRINQYYEVVAGDDGWRLIIYPAGSTNGVSAQILALGLKNGSLVVKFTADKVIPEVSSLLGTLFRIGDGWDEERKKFLGNSVTIGLAAVESIFVKNGKAIFELPVGPINKREVMEIWNAWIESQLGTKVVIRKGEEI